MHHWAPIILSKVDGGAGCYPGATLTTRVTVAMVTGRGVADAQSLGFGGATVGCLRYDFGREGWTILLLNQCSEARKMGRFGRNKLTIKELPQCRLQMFLSATRMESCWSREKTSLLRRKSIINNEEFKSWRQETHCGVIPWSMAAWHHMNHTSFQLKQLVWSNFSVVFQKKLRVYLYPELEPGIISSK